MPLASAAWKDRNPDPVPKLMLYSANKDIWPEVEEESLSPCNSKLHYYSDYITGSYRHLLSKGLLQHTLSKEDSSTDI